MMSTTPARSLTDPVPLRALDRERVQREDPFQWSDLERQIWASALLDAQGWVLLPRAQTEAEE